MTEPDAYDLVIIGAGPTGLFAAYYAGFRGLKMALVDSLPDARLLTLQGLDHFATPKDFRVMDAALEFIGATI